MKQPRSIALVLRYATAGRVLAPEQILDVAERAQPDAVVLDSGLPRDLVEPLQLLLERRRQQFSVLALECPCPRSVGPESREPELCAPDRDESQAALEAALATLRRAGDMHARFAIVSLGEVRPAAKDWVFARDQFLRGKLDEELAQRLISARDAVAERSVDASRRALDRLAREAERAGVVLALRNGRRYIDIPSPREIDRLREDLQGAPVVPLLDVPAAHLTDVMGLRPMPLTLAAWDRAPLVYYGDACGPIGGLAPGRGIVDLPSLKRTLDDDAILTFNPWSGLTLDEVVEGCVAIRK